MGINHLDLKTMSDIVLKDPEFVGFCSFGIYLNSPFVPFI